MEARLERIDTSANYIQNILEGVGLKPVVGIVLGSGLGKLADQISQPVTIPYREIPGFPISTAIGHKGCQTFCSLFCPYSFQIL